MTRRAAAATTASPPGSRSSASSRRSRSEPAASDPAGPGGRAAAKAAKGSKASRASKGTKGPKAPRATRAAERADAVAPAMVAPAVEAPRRTRAKRGQGDQLREQILDATYELLVETGNADKVSTRAVAQRVGCSSPALYLHFPDRAALLWATCNRQFLRLGDLIASAVAGLDDPLEALLAAGRAYVRFGVEHAEEYRVMMMVPDMVIWNPPMSELPNEAGFAILHDLIQRGMAAGLIREDDPTMVALTVWAAVHGIVSLRVAKPSFEWPPIDEQIDRMLDLITTGLATSSDGPSVARGGRTRPRSRRSAARSTR